MVVTRFVDCAHNKFIYISHGIEKNTLTSTYSVYTTAQYICRFTKLVIYWEPCTIYNVHVCISFFLCFPTISCLLARKLVCKHTNVDKKYGVGVMRVRLIAYIAYIHDAEKAYNMATHTQPHPHIQKQWANIIHRDNNSGKIVYLNIPETTTTQISCMQCILRFTYT